MKKRYVVVRSWINFSGSFGINNVYLRGARSWTKTRERATKFATKAKANAARDKCGHPNHAYVEEATI